MLLDLDSRKVLYRGEKVVKDGGEVVVVGIVDGEVRRVGRRGDGGCKVR